MSNIHRASVKSSKLGILISSKYSCYAWLIAHGTPSVSQCFQGMLNKTYNIMRFVLFHFTVIFIYDQVIKLCICARNIKDGLVSNMAHGSN